LDSIAPKWLYKNVYKLVIGPFYIIDIFVRKFRPKWFHKMPDVLRALPVAPEPLGGEAGDAEHPEVDEDPDFGVVIPLWSKTSVARFLYHIFRLILC
jgi:hypothetical protein